MDQYRLAPIPAQFFQESEKVPFTRCNSCETRFDSATVYIVEKAFQTFPPYKSRDVVFEYALCMDCYESLSESLSEQSRKAIADYIDTRVDLNARAERLLGDSFQNEASFDHINAGAWLDRCFVSGRAPEDLDGYQIAGVFIGSHIILTHAPFLVSSDVVGEIADCLSKKTIDVLGGFAKDILPQPPGFERDVPRPVLVI